MSWRITESYGFARLVGVWSSRRAIAWRCHVTVRPQTLANPLCDASVKDAFLKRRCNGRSTVVMRHPAGSLDGDVCINALSLRANVRCTVTGQPLVDFELIVSIDSTFSCAPGHIAFQWVQRCPTGVQSCILSFLNDGVEGRPNACFSIRGAPYRCCADNSTQSSNSAERASPQGECQIVQWVLRLAMRCEESHRQQQRHVSKTSGRSLECEGVCEVREPESRWRRCARWCGQRMGGKGRFLNWISRM